MALIPTLVLAGIEKTLNSLLSRDPAAPTRLSKLAGQRILLRLESPQLALVLAYHAQGIDLMHADALEMMDDDQDYDAVVEVDSEGLAALASGAEMERLMFEGRLAVRGRVHLLEATRDLLLDLDLDWEAEMARWLGDVPAHQLAEGLRGLSRWGIRTQRELRSDISEYVFEEARWLPGRQQFESLRDLLIDLEQATDRVEARLARLHRLLDAEGGLS
ncbi:ubiquinone biosynthesis accessory factor UbiJ [Halomonas huangheensis]|uniref:Ubiquinone biosynthesis accessory factor UbiJ n=1 Tax=Halomonas huangheensis TaxID=1178482 RepID=W1N3V2_9GAMM|nr:SCP2 sterol-binding domain-containing protein [Halomonas huangheensis]ALM51376.1 hypothetical protein AR456_02995 [Halomonas huangheensis]ERL49816.1 hypothetical protein BJB45_01465 [Halomonas huangheensis]